MAWRTLAWIGSAALVIAAASCNDETSDGDGGAAGTGGSAGSGGQGLTAGTGGTGGTTTGTGGLGGGGTMECFEFSDDPNIPLALDGDFVASSETWKRPHDEPAVCPATALLPDTAADVPYVAYAFCNNDTVAHNYDFEMLAQEGTSGETPLDDPYLFLYQGVGIPADPLQCLAVNDDIPDALQVKDSEILGVTVPPGGAITMVGTTYTFEVASETGMGHYILVVTNAD